MTTYHAPPCPVCQRRNGLKATPTETKRGVCLHCRTPLVTEWTYNEDTDEWQVWWAEDGRQVAAD